MCNRCPTEQTAADEYHAARRHLAAAVKRLRHLAGQFPPNDSDLAAECAELAYAITLALARSEQS